MPKIVENPGFGSNHPYMRGYHFFSHLTKIAFITLIALLDKKTDFHIIFPLVMNIVFSSTKVFYIKYREMRTKDDVSKFFIITTRLLVKMVADTINIIILVLLIIMQIYVSNI